MYLRSNRKITLKKLIIINYIIIKQYKCFEDNINKNYECFKKEQLYQDYFFVTLKKRNN